MNLASPQKALLPLVEKADGPPSLAVPHSGPKRSDSQFRRCFFSASECLAVHKCLLRDQWKTVFRDFHCKQRNPEEFEEHRDICIYICTYIYIYVCMYVCMCVCVFLDTAISIYCRIYIGDTPTWLTMLLVLYVVIMILWHNRLQCQIMLWCYISISLFKKGMGLACNMYDRLYYGRAL